MADQPFLSIQQSATATLPPPDLDRTVISIHWKESVVKTIKIQHCYIGQATKLCLIQLKPDCQSRENARLDLNGRAQKNFAPKPGRRAV